MKKHLHIFTDDTRFSSGFSILLHSSAARFLVRLWMRFNTLVRPLLPSLRLFMLVATSLILVATIFANQHAPGWYDEICMLDPAYHRATTGIWHSIAQWDSIHTIPFAPNYPLLINILRLLVAIFGVNFWILRGSMLAFGLIPVVALLWLFRRKGLLQSHWEMLYLLYFASCFSLFYWSVYIRPEAILLSVATLLVFTWTADKPLLLFLSALMVPLCGLQWNVLLLPAVLHWLAYGGRLRNPILVALAFGLSTAATIAAYHFLGMWPSYLQEAARVGGLDALHTAIDKVRQLVCHGNCRFIVWGCLPYDALPGLFLLFAGPLFVPLFDNRRSAAQCLFFALATWTGTVLSLAFLGSLNGQYTKLLSLPLAIFVCLYFLPLWRKSPAFLLLLSVLALPLAIIHWNEIKNMPSYRTPMTSDVSSTANWNDERSLRKNVAGALYNEDVVVCESPAYFAIRSYCKDMLPLCYSFDFSPEQIAEITAVLVSDEPYRIGARDNSMDRRTSWASALNAYLRHVGMPFPDDGCISPDTLLSAIASRWQCTFTEIPMAPSPMPNAIRYRLFRPSFSPSEGALSVN